MGLGPRTASKIFGLFRDFTVETFNAVSKSGEWAVDAAETGIGKFRPGTKFAPVIREPAKFVAGSAVVGGGAGAALGATEQTAKEILTKYAPNLLPDDMKVKDDKPFAERFGEKVIPSAGNGALFLPTLVWNASRGIYNYVTGNTTDKPKETPPVTSVAQPPVTPDPTTATAAEAAAKKAAQEQADRADALGAEKKKVEAAKQTEADKMAAEKARRDAEFESAKKEEERRLQEDTAKKAAERARADAEMAEQRRKTEAEFERKTSRFRNNNGEITLWSVAHELERMANAPGMPRFFGQAVSWLVRAAESDIGRSLLTGFGLLKAGGNVISAGWDFLSGKMTQADFVEKVGKGAGTGALMMWAGMSDPNADSPAGADRGRRPPEPRDDDTYDSPHGRRRRDDLQQGSRPHYYQVNAGSDGQSLDQGASSRRDFRTAAADGSTQQQPAVNQPVYSYGTQKDGTLAASFEKPASGVIPAAPPVQTVPEYRKPTGNDWEYNIDRSA